MIRSVALRQAVAFTSLVYSMTIAIALALPHSGLTPVLSLFTPVLGVLIVSVAATRKGQHRAIWGDMRLGHTGIRSWPAAIAFPVLFLGVAYAAALLLGVARLRQPGLSPAGLARSVPDVVLILGVGPVIILGEEIGWRGFLLPRLQTVLSRPKAALTTGLIHGMFHLPAILLTTTYDRVGNRLIVAPTVVATITFAGVFYAWLRDRSGSIWPVAIAHNTANAAFDFGASAVTASSPAALAYTAGESGIATLLGVAAVGIWLLSNASVWHESAQRSEVFNAARRDDLLVPSQP